MKAVSNMYKEKPADAMDHSVTYICTFVFIIILLLLLLFETSVMRHSKNSWNVQELFYLPTEFVWYG